MRAVSVPSDDLQPVDRIRIAHHIVEHLWTVFLNPVSHELDSSFDQYVTYQGSSYGVSAGPVAFAFDEDDMWGIEKNYASVT